MPRTGGRAVPTTVLEFDGFRLHLLRRQLYAPNGAVIVLSNNELTLLTTLLERPNEVFDRAALAQQAGIGDPSDIAGPSTCRSAAFAASCRPMRRWS